MTTWVRRDFTERDKKHLIIAVAAWLCSLVIHILSFTIVPGAQLIAGGYLYGEYYWTLIVNSIVLVLNAVLIGCGYAFKGRQKYFNSAFIVSAYVSGMVYLPTLGVFLLVMFGIP